MHRTRTTRLEIHESADATAMDDKARVVFEVRLVGVDVGVIVNFDRESASGVAVASNGLRDLATGTGV